MKSAFLFWVLIDTCLYLLLNFFNRMKWWISSMLRCTCVVFLKLRAIPFWPAKSIWTKILLFWRYVNFVMKFYNLGSIFLCFAECITFILEFKEIKIHGLFYCGQKGHSSFIDSNELSLEFCCSLFVAKGDFSNVVWWYETSYFKSNDLKNYTEIIF